MTNLLIRAAFDLASFPKCQCSGGGFQDQLVILRILRLPPETRGLATRQRIGRSYLRNAWLLYVRAPGSTLSATFIIPHPPTTAEATKASFCPPWVRSTHLTSFCNIRQNGGETTEKLPSSLFYNFYCWKSDSVKDFN